MNIKDFNEALYASSNGVVVEHRKRIIIPIIILLIGVAMLVANYFIEDSESVNNLKSALILFGGLATIVGIAYCVACIFGSGTPYHKEDKCLLLCNQYSFDRAQLQVVEEAVKLCDKSALDALPESDIATLPVICYYSPKSSYCAMQAYMYEGFDYQSVTPFSTRE